MNNFRQMLKQSDKILFFLTYIFHNLCVGIVSIKQKNLFRCKKHAFLFQSTHQVKFFYIRGQKDLPEMLDLMESKDLKYFVLNIYMFLFIYDNIIRLLLYANQKSPSPFKPCRVFQVWRGRWVPLENQG